NGVSADLEPLRGAGPSRHTDQDRERAENRENETDESAGKARIHASSTFLRAPGGSERTDSITKSRAGQRPMVSVLGVSTHVPVSRVVVGVPLMYDAVRTIGGAYANAPDRHRRSCSPINNS